MNPVIFPEATKFQIADLHRDAERGRLVRDARRARREQRHSGRQAASGHPASVLTSYARVLFGARSPGCRPVTARPQDGIPRVTRASSASEKAAGLDPLRLA